MKRITGKVAARCALVVALIAVGSVYATRHVRPSDNEDFFSCREQSLNAFYAEQARKGVVFDEAAQAGIQSVSIDHCMSDRGYLFTGGSEVYCMSQRANLCYQRRWSVF